VYLWFKGGNECINSTLEPMWALEIAGRWLTQASHKINRKNKTDTTETTDPTLATTFQKSKESGKSE